MGTADDGALGDYRVWPGSPAIDAGSSIYLDEIDSDDAGPDLEIDLDGSGTIGDYTIATDLAGGPRMAGATVSRRESRFRPRATESSSRSTRRGATRKHWSVSGAA